LGEVASGELTSARRLGHDLRGTGASYGVPTLGVLGADLESAAKRVDVDGTRAALEQLLAALEGLRWRTRES
jgi:HPt (histidine-containing phosphotransfer) domain-containing protein